MGKRHDYAAKEQSKQEKNYPQRLLIPTSRGYKKASAETLIFLAIESSASLSTGEDIANQISKITGGVRHFKQPHISKVIKEMNENGFIARDKCWFVRKVDGRYKLVDADADEVWEVQRKADLREIPFDRSIYFRNDPIRGSVFGFRLRTVSQEITSYIEKIRVLFNKITYNHVFQVIVQENTVYILLDTSSDLYIEAVRNLNRFLENEYRIKK